MVNTRLVSGRVSCSRVDPAGHLCAYEKPPAQPRYFQGWSKRVFHTGYGIYQVASGRVTLFKGVTISGTIRVLWSVLYQLGPEWT